VRELTARSVTFRKSTYSAGIGQCVEVGCRHAGGVLLRDSMNADGTWIPVSSAGWREFVSRVQSGKVRALTCR
jgi:Domain of unknown function (DUF397)